MEVESEMSPWFITDEGYSAAHDQTMKGEHCAVLCELGECCGDCNKCEVYKDTQEDDY